jgi:NADH dehydrogenase FAD-containing subunit
MNAGTSSRAVSSIQNLKMFGFPADLIHDDDAFKADQHYSIFGFADRTRHKKGSPETRMTRIAVVGGGATGALATVLYS